MRNKIFLKWQMQAEHVRKGKHAGVPRDRHRHHTAVSRDTIDVTAWLSYHGDLKISWQPSQQIKDREKGRELDCTGRECEILSTKTKELFEETQNRISCKIAFLGQQKGIADYIYLVAPGAIFKCCIFTGYVHCKSFQPWLNLSFLIFLRDKQIFRKITIKSNEQEKIIRKL